MVVNTLKQNEVNNQDDTIKIQYDGVIDNEEKYIKWTQKEFCRRIIKKWVK